MNFVFVACEDVEIKKILLEIATEKNMFFADVNDFIRYELAGTNEEKITQEHIEKIEREVVENTLSFSQCVVLLQDQLFANEQIEKLVLSNCKPFFLQGRISSVGNDDEKIQMMAQKARLQNAGNKGVQIVSITKKTRKEIVKTLQNLF